MSDLPGKSKLKARTLRTILRGSFLLGLFFVLYFPFGNQPTTRGQLLPVDGGGSGGFIAKWVASSGNQSPVAVVGISKDTNATGSYAPSVDVKFGAPTPLFFSAFLGANASPTSQSSDPDGWTAANGVSTSGKCAFNLDLSRATPITFERNLASPASPTSCEASQTGDYTFNDGADNADQIFKPMIYNALQITDNGGLVSNEAPITINVHYAPTASITANGGATATFNAGSSVTIAWSSTHASSCTGTGFSTGNAASGSVDVTPTAPITYSISCSGSSLWNPASASANVGANPPTADIKANGSDGPISVAEGSQVSLAWTSTNATSCAGTGFSTGDATSNTVTTSGLTAATTFTVTCTGAGGSATDSVIVNITFDYTIAKNRDITTLQGSSGSAVITASRTAGTGQSVALSMDPGLPLPAGVSPSFSPANCTPSPDTCTSTLTFSATNATPVGSFPLRVKGTSGSLVKSVDISLSVSSRMDVDLTGPSSAIAGTPIVLTATVSNYTGAPADTLNYKFWKNCVNPESQNLQTIITACGNPDAVFDGVSANPQSATLTYATTGSFTPKVFVQRRAAANEDRADNPVVVGAAFDYTLTNGGSVSILRGTTGAQTIQVTTQSGAPSSVSFITSKVTGLPAGVTPSFSPSSCTPPPTVGSSCASDIVLSLAVPASTPVTASPLTITVTDNGPLGKATTFSLSITATPPFTFTLAREKDISVIQGATINNTSIITATKTGGTGEAITFAASGLPQGASASFSPSSCTPGASPCTSAMAITTTSATPAGVHSLTITGTAAGGATTNVPLTLTVSSRMDVDLTGPSSAIAGTPIVLTATVSNYTGAPADTLNYKFWKNCVNPESQNLQTIITACGNPDAVFDGVSANPQSATLTYATTGSFTPKVFVQRRAAANEDRADNPVVVVPAFTFTLANSGNISVIQGATAGNANTITVTKTAGAGQAVLLSASGLPVSASAAFTPTSCTPGASPCTSTMTITTARGTGATPTGTYPITITGTAGAVIASAPPFNLIVSSQMSVNLSALPSVTGPAPYVLQLQAIAPAVDYTGEPTDAITYTFWKNCDQAGTNVAALSAASVCGAPDHVTTNVLEFTARTNDLIYTQQGAYRAKVVASRAAASAESRITITVNPPFGFSLALERPRVELVQGTNSAGANQITATHTSGTPTALTFGAQAQNIPPSAPNPVISFSPSSCTPPSGGFCAADISVSTRPELPVGDYQVVITAGSKNITFTLGITSRIDVGLAAVPLAAGSAPHLAQLRATASNYTGSSIDALNYSFWWNCNNPTDSPSAAQDACGDPTDAAVGFKMNGTMQEIFTTPGAHVYATEGIYFAKVIVERGGARREARLAITVGNPKVSVSCSVAPVVAVVNQPVVWTAAPALGTAPYGYAWTQNVSCGLNPAQCASVPMQYASAGDKFGSVAITDAKGDTATRLCDNALKVFQPTLVIVPPTAQIRADGDTMQFVAKYDPDGPGGSQPEQTVTGNAVWSIPLGEQQRAAVSAGGLVTTKSVTGSVTLTTSFKDAFNNVIAATAAISVIPRENLVCDPAEQTVRTGEQTFPMRASGGTGLYDWLVQETDATPRAGSTVGSQTFSTMFSQTGTKTVGVTSGSQSGSCEVEVTGQNLSVNLSAFPASVTVPDSTRLTAVVSGNALGTMNYSYWWDCGQDKDADNTTRVEITEGRCGVLPTSVPVGQCQENQFGAKCNVISTVSRAIDHIYQEAGAKSPKVIVERGNAAPAQHKASVSVDAANTAPDAVAGISADVNDTRVYAPSIVVTQNVPTQIYFAAFTGTRQTQDEKSTDPNGWTNTLNGVYHPNTPAASGQCAWNANLDRDAQVSFEDVSGTNRNPASEKECVTSFVHNFAETGTHTYAVLRITDNRGAVSEPAVVTVDVVSPGAPVSMPGVSNDPSAERIYKETVRVKQGESVELWVSAKRRVGAADIISSDPDGWRSRNGGVSRGGSCRWNRDLDKGVFPTGVPTYEYVINDPQDPSEDCDTKIVNEAGTSFVRVFNDVPREDPYSFEALRIFDNTGLRSNKGMIKVQVLPSDPPTAVASASTDGGATFHGITPSDPIIVVRGAPTPIVFSAAGSTDPDGWTNPVNGVSASGHCDWNSDLNQGAAVTFENRIVSPASPAACSPAPRTFTFNDRPGVIDFAALNITDNKGFTSLSPGGVSIRVTAPDLVISDGPLPTSAAALVENGSAAFRGKVKNQGDAGTAAAFGTVFRLDLGNNGSTDATLASTPATVADLAVGAEREITSASFAGLPAGTHKITLCADQPAPAVANEFFTDNNCASQVITVLPDNRPPSAEAGISTDGITYGPSITVLRGTPLQIWLSADKDVDGNTVASHDPDGWSDPEKGVAAGGKCDWNIDLQSIFAAQNTVNNPASPTICNRNRMDKTFNDAPGTYMYPVLRITDVKGGQSAVAQVSVRVVASASQLTHMGCVNEACTVVSGVGANVCSTAGISCTGGGGGPGGGGGIPRADLVTSRAPRRATGKLERGDTVTFNGRVQNQSSEPIAIPFKNAFLIDLNNNGTTDVTLRTLPRALDGIWRTQVGALPFSDIILPLPQSVASLGADEEATVLSGEWRGIPEGTHRVTLCADSDNEITESNEDNNCDSTLVTVTPPGGAGGPLLVQSCSASASEIRAGQLVDWTANVAGGTGAYSYSWSGDAPLEGSPANPVSVAYQTTGVKSGSVIVTSGNETASRTCGTVNVLPGIISFGASPRQIRTGQTSALAWDTTGFSSCAITADQPGQSIGGVPTVGTRDVQPTRNTVYTLTCSDGGASQSVTVVVSSTPRQIECVVGTPGCYP